MNNDEIDPRKFDDLIELIAKADNDVIIDNGASTCTDVTLSYQQSDTRLAFRYGA